MNKIENFDTNRKRNYPQVGEPTLREDCDSFCLLIVFRLRPVREDGSFFISKLFNKNPYGVISETPKGLLKTQNKNPYGVIYKTPYPFF